MAVGDGGGEGVKRRTATVGGALVTKSTPIAGVAVGVRLAAGGVGRGETSPHPSSSMSHPTIQIHRQLRPSPSFTFLPSPFFLDFSSFKRVSIARGGGFDNDVAPLGAIAYHLQNEP
jgi:hypothetical protein